MAQTENGVGISFKLADGTMIWARRDTYAELIEDVKIIRGETYTTSLEVALKGGQPNLPTASVTPISEEAAVAIAEQERAGLDTCPKCGGPKSKLVPAGFSQKTQKAYKAFYVCPTPGH